MRIRPLFPLFAGFILQLFIVMLDIYLIDVDNSGEVWRLIREGIFGVSVFFIFIFINGIHSKKEPLLRENLLTIIRDILIIFATGFTLNLIIPIDTNFVTDQQPILTEKSIIYHGIITFIALYAFTEILILLRPFIYYRRDRFTQLQYSLFISLVLFTAVITAIFNLQSPVNLLFTKETIIPDIFLILTILISFWLSTRNKWISFLSRKEKYFYFVGSLFFFTTLIFLSQWLDEIPKHTILGATYANLLWLFLFIYSGLAAVYLLFHLPTARVLDRKLKELQSLQSLTTAISRELDFDRLVVLVTKTISEVLESHSCWLILVDHDSGREYIASYQNLSHGQVQTINSGDDGKLTRKILDKNETVSVESVSSDPYFRSLLKIHPGMESLIAIPMYSGNERGLGVLFASKNIRYGFTPEDLVLMEAFANQAIIAIENTRRIQESLERERLLQEMSIAMEVQKRLLPQQTPTSKCYDFAAISKPASEVGGDYYDFLIAKDKHTILIGDVSGKGASAAFYMAELKGAIQANRKLCDSPIELLIQTNNSIFDSLDKATFITMAALLLDEKKSVLRYSRAGHNVLLKYNGNGIVEEINPPGLGIGLVKGPIFDRKISQFESPVKPGELYVMYTDGITEAMNSAREEFGEERLKKIILDSYELNAKEMVDKIISEVEKFAEGTPPHDDMTLVIIKVCGENSNK